MAVEEKELRDRERQFQDDMLKGVSRTFALTIPLLPSRLRFAVTNAYLLCRIIDTIEDEPALSYLQKEYFCHHFLKVVFEGADPAGFSDQLSRLLSAKTIHAEHVLIRNAARVVSATRSLTSNQREILERCLKTMTKGMLYFQKGLPHSGVADLTELNRYCYYVAGVIGDLLTHLFSDYSPGIAVHYNELIDLSNSFGLGLQLTNILKDIWEDHKNGVCWLPRDVFMQCDFNLDDMRSGQVSKEFDNGINKIVGITRAHLQKAVDYTLTIPQSETGIRKFCFWNIGMASLTLKKINRHPGFSSAEEVKISRSSVKWVALTSNLNIKYNYGLKTLFSLWTWGLPQTKLPQARIYIDI